MSCTTLSISSERKETQIDDSNDITIANSTIIPLENSDSESSEKNIDPQTKETLQEATDVEWIRAHKGESAEVIPNGIVYTGFIYPTKKSNFFIFYDRENVRSEDLTAHRVRLMQMDSFIPY